MKYPKKYSLYLGLLVLVVAATQRFDLKLVGRVPLGNIIAFSSLVFLMPGVPFSKFGHRLKLVLLCFGLWAMGIIISDMINGVQFQLFARGFTRLAWCFLWMLFFICVIYKDHRALLWYPAGAVLASIQNYLFPQAWTIDRIQSGDYSAVAYGIAPIVMSTALFIAVLVYGKSRLLTAVVMFLTAVALIELQAPRSSAAIYLLNCLIFTYIAWVQRSGARRIQFSLKKLVGFGVTLLIASFIIFEAYVFAAYQGWLGEFQLAKLTAQSNTLYGNNLLGLLLSGRTAVFGAILAIGDNPLFGYGSWSGATLTDHFYDAVAFVGTDASELSRLASLGGGAAPGHSIFFANWMESGILAAIGTGGIGLIAIKEFAGTIQFESRITPLLVVFSTSFFWAFLFSPLGTMSRMYIGLFLAFYVVSFHSMSHALNRPKVGPMDERTQRSAV